jgi:hypothetical protein
MLGRITLFDLVANVKDPGPKRHFNFDPLIRPAEGNVILPDRALQVNFSWYLSVAVSSEIITQLLTAGNTLAPHSGQ